MCPNFYPTAICHPQPDTLNNHITIKKSTIYVDYNSTIILHEGVRLEGIGLWVTNGGRVEIGAHSFLERSSNATKPEYIVNSGVLRVADHTKLACQRLWIRFGGSIEVGQYTNVNPGSEIRADEKVIIGSYCQLSYNLRIWDTNTHCIYSPEKRNRLTDDFYSSVFTLIVTNDSKGVVGRSIVHYNNLDVVVRLFDATIEGFGNEPL
jgi:hypothetical protein